MNVRENRRGNQEKFEDSKEVIRRRKSRRTDNAMTKTTGKKQKWSEKYYTENLDLET
jgi:hypothetical protein